MYATLSRRSIFAIIIWVILFHTILIALIIVANPAQVKPVDNDKPIQVDYINAQITPEPMVIEDTNDDEEEALQEVEPNSPEVDIADTPQPVEQSVIQPKELKSVPEPTPTPKLEPKPIESSPTPKPPVPNPTPAPLPKPEPTVIASSSDTSSSQREVERQQRNQQQLAQARREQERLQQLQEQQQPLEAQGLQQAEAKRLEIEAAEQKRIANERAKQEQARRAAERQANTVIAARYSNEVRADYPRRELQRGRTGSVSFKFTIGTNGKAKNISVTSATSSQFEEAALTALKASSFQVTKINGNPVEQKAQKTISFKLN